MLTGVTAIHALRATKTGAGDTLLVHGAAGGVGLTAVQVAVADGVRVIGTASEGERERLRSLGVEPVVYGDGLLERVRALAPNGVTAAIDLSDRRGRRRVGRPCRRPRPDRNDLNTERSTSKGIQALGGGPGADPGVEIRSAARLELIRRVEEGRCESSLRRRSPWLKPRLHIDSSPAATRTARSFWFLSSSPPGITRSDPLLCHRPVSSSLLTALRSRGCGPR